MSSAPPNSSAKKAVSLRHVAEVAGVSRMTVSRAFKEDASIKPELRKKILKVAKELGYRPDTIVSELMSGFANRRPIHYQETFAAIWWPERWQKVDTGHGFDADIYRELIDGGQVHGRKIDHFVLSKEMTPRVLSRILKARNIQGALLTPPISIEIEAPKLAWDTLSTVMIGSSLREPKFHRAQASHCDAMVQVMETLKPRGYKRPCLLLRSDVEKRMLCVYAAAFLAWGYPEKNIWHARTPCSEDLGLWLGKNYDVIISDWDPWYELIDPADKEYGFISLAVRDKYGSVSGIYQNSYSMEKFAIDLLLLSHFAHPCHS